ncbi:MAG: galactose-1-epimerase [Bacteroidetes bacterium HGW-Bacteroidetes-17]|jgi:aldose 1-epimerase|nr:MAG: galactose-1-epimerase [Bacteroidetes bacterium HGW-Bacteroidetes-17]
MKQNLILVALFLISMAACTSKSQKQNMNQTNEKFQVVELNNTAGMKVKISNFGGSIMSILAPDKEGNFGEVVLGFDTPEEYLNGNPYFGALIGRYGNRIANGKFELNGKVYELARNNGENHLHGGNIGYNNVFWDIPEYSENAVKLHYLSKDGEEGYPGNLDIQVTYTLTENNEIEIDYLAETDQPTVLNLTHHSFFNLKDGGKSTILDHELMINAYAYTPVDVGLIPTGEIMNVENTPMDFHTQIPIGQRIAEDYEQLKMGKGYDHNWVLNKNANELTLAARVYEPSSGRTMEVYTTEPALQFYSGNFLDGTDKGHNGILYPFRSAFCLETQHYPDSPNHADFPSTVLNPGEKYTQKTIYKFGVNP